MCGAGQRPAPQELIKLFLRGAYHCLLASACLHTPTLEERAGGDECCCLWLVRTIEPLFPPYGLIENFSVGTYIRNAQAVLTLEFWFLFPVAITIAIFAMATGVSGANFFAPVYLLWLQLDPQLGFWLSLVSMLFGFSSGLIRNLLQGTVNFFLLRTYLKVTLPLAILGALIAPAVRPRWLFLAFAVFVFTYSTWVLLGLARGEGGAPIIKHERIYWEVAALGGFLTGLIAVGLGKLIMPCCLRHRCCHSPAEAVGTTVALVFFTSLCASLARLTPSLLSVLTTRYQQLLGILLFVVPGVLIGGQLGPRVAYRVSLTVLRSLLVCVLYVISGLMFLRFWFDVG